MMRWARAGKEGFGVQLRRGERERATISWGGGEEGAVAPAEKKEKEKKKKSLITLPILKKKKRGGPRERKNELFERHPKTPKKPVGPFPLGGSVGDGGGGGKKNG